MKRQYTQKEIEMLLKTMTVVVDTREQVWSHIESGLKAMKRPYERGKLDYGDYTCKLPDLSWQSEYNITVIFSRPEDSARIISGHLFYWLKKRLESGAK